MGFCVPQKFVFGLLLSLQAADVFEQQVALFKRQTHARRASDFIPCLIGRKDQLGANYFPLVEEEKVFR